jgi:hypothetical protein
MRKRITAVVAFHSDFKSFCEYKVSSLSFSKKLFYKPKIKSRQLIIGNDVFELITSVCDTRGRCFHDVIYWKEFWYLQDDIKEIGLNIYIQMMSTRDSVYDRRNK